MAWDKIPSQKEAVKAFLVMASGQIQLEASVEKFRSALLQHVANQTAEDSLIGECMSKVFDQYPGATLNTDFIKSQTIIKMTERHPELKSPNLFNTLATKVQDYLHANCDRPAKAAKGDKPEVPAITDRTYAIKMGPSGGFYRK